MRTPSQKRALGALFLLLALAIAGIAVEAGGAAVNGHPGVWVIAAAAAAIALWLAVMAVRALRPG